MDKEAVASVLAEIGTLLELKGENPFKTRAYQNAARTLEGLSEPLETIVAEDRLKTIPGIGEALCEKITTLVTTGRLPYYEDLKASLPPGLVDLLGLQGVGPKKVKKLHDTLGVDSIESLEAACRAGRVAALDGFGEKSQTKILEAIAFKRQFASRHRLVDALAAAEPILEALRGHPNVTRCSVAGSLRRWKEVIGDVDFVVSSRDPAPVIAHFVEQAGIQTVLARGDTKASVLLESGIQADLRVVADREYPFALAYFTGSKEHNIAMRQRAIAHGLRLNEYGLFRSQEETRDPSLCLPCEDEEGIYRTLELAYVPPELREDHGELVAAEKDALPRLVEWTDLKGSLHNHSNWSDGRNTLDDIASHMRELGLAYWAITDHSRASFQANGLDPARLRQQIRAVDVVNRRMEDEGAAFRLLTGIEVDILKDGLDFPDSVLEGLDVVVASLHVPGSTEAENTRRLVAAASNRWVHMIGHPSGRLLLERDAYKVNLDAVIEACAAHGTWIELNASPYRFDLDWRLWQRATARGVKCVINCDAHRLEHAGFLRLGAGIARKGWLTKDDVINTRPLAALRRALASKRAGKEAGGG
ncbi:MAG: DNA polymerase/3'-5' exonuclease PolX [Verrucomicrobiae bacterium]|nr:DNA polymerase/3'-5' exonuclease PolX [Verrucomicrobiae bacterium]